MRVRAQPPSSRDPDLSPCSLTGHGCPSFPQIQNFDDEDNLLFCENCNRKTPALEEKRFLRLPKILILQVRELTFENGKFHKIQGPISVSEVLTLQIGPKKADASHSTDSCRARPSPALEQKRYHLYAMCNHSGDCTGGHYTALIRPRGQQHWYRFNDRHVQWVGTLPGPNALRPEVPYLLMYRCEDSEDRQEEEPKDEVPEQRAWDTAVPQRRGPPAEGQGRAPKRHTAAALPEDSTLASPLLEHSEEWTGAGGSGAQTKRRPWVEASQSLDKAGENAGHQDPEGLKKTLERELATEPEGDSGYGLSSAAMDYLGWPSASHLPME
ncbi:ubl carboxyl-terminal hydrolase 18-like isoform X2 [Tamandua tetradactyla]|uniref:ubl carboxyl-terminal hydrolase 18-like isoform X2 n=1 Tax=Tamandua tetradactyla TaxID=48850 RepID=UPI0040539885